MNLGKGKIAPTANIARDAVVIGDVEKIVIGNFSNIQDNCTVHVDKGFPAVIGDWVTVGHNAVIHGCTIGDGTVIGMGSIILNGARIGKECMIGAGSLVLQGQEIPDGCLAVGSPARVKRPLTEDEIRHLYENSRAYVETGKRLREEGYTKTDLPPADGRGQIR